MAEGTRTLSILSCPERHHTLHSPFGMRPEVEDRFRTAYTIADRRIVDLVAFAEQYDLVLQRFHTNMSPASYLTHIRPYSSHMAGCVRLVSLDVGFVELENDCTCASSSNEVKSYH